MDASIFFVVVSAALLVITFIIIFCLYIFVHRIYIVSVATKDPGKGPRKITNILKSIWGTIWGAIPRSIEYSKPEARFRRVRPCTSSANNTKTDPNDHLVTKEAK